MRRAIVDYRTTGEVILERLAGVALPPLLKAPVAEFRARHRAVEAASRLVEEARARRDEAIARVGSADETLDQLNGRLADLLVGAGLGKRRQPFATFGGPSPSDLNQLAYAAEVKAVRALIRAIERSKPPLAIRRASANCLAQANAVEQALKAIAVPQAAYQRALHARDALLPEWERALRRLKRHAAVAWEDDSATRTAVFAPPGPHQRPVRRRSARKKGAGQREVAPVA